MTKKGENEVSHKIRACDMLCNNIPVILNKTDNMWDIFGGDIFDDGLGRGLIDKDWGIDSIINFTKDNSFYRAERFEFQNVLEHNMGWLT